MHLTISRVLSPLVGLSAMGRAYRRAARGDAAQPFPRRALAELGISLEIDQHDLNRLPVEGPVVVVANHPFGAVDGLALLELVGRRRSDVRVLANHFLAALPDVREHVIAVDAFGGRGARARNMAAIRTAAAWLRAGGCLCVFPAGEVAHDEADGQVHDSPWRPTAAELAVQAGAVAVPVRFAGHNSRLFLRAGRLHPVLRTALLPREMWAMRGATVDVRMGDALSPSRLRALASPAERIVCLRHAVDALEHRGTAVPVARRGHDADIARDVEALGPSALAETGTFAVHCACADALPHVLPEIGRLRELAFRAAGEGTGRARDLDDFDTDYRHLFVWDRSRREVAGAYRLRSTEDLGRRGSAGLYTRTLFEFGDDLLSRMGPAIELGRSFVAPAYQRDYSPLLLLWKGICRFVAQHPTHRRLFGAVSISDRYASTTRALMAAFLSANRLDQELAPLVQARHPFPRAAEPRVAVAASGRLGPLGNDAEALSAAVRQIERDGKDIPVLLRQYLRLNAKLLAFSLDPSFGDVLDGLLVVNLLDVDAALLGRYMGRSELAAFRAFHASTDLALAS
jgi:putative hemolysin